EPFAQTIDQFTDSEFELFVDESPRGRRRCPVLADLDDPGVHKGIRSECHQSLRTCAAARETPTSQVEGQIPGRSRADTRCQFTGSDSGSGIAELRYDSARPGVFHREREPTMPPVPAVAFDSHSDHTL